jgi:hypothetical protein
MKAKYLDFNFRPKTLEVIRTANLIIAEYLAAGYDLTLRQLYYQFVARGIIPNSDAEYKKLGSAVNDGRLAGLIDWDSIIDRTRPDRHNPHWDNPQEIIDACGQQFNLDTRINQDFYIEVWIEKDALLGILEQVCINLDVPYFSCRGYVSQSSMYEAAQRFIREENSKQTILVHLGDHDPSGIDMTRDIQDRLKLFESDCKVLRIALMQEQIDEYNLPPNPAKITDSRCAGYIAEHGNESWELDALEPQTITALIENAVGDYTDFARREKLVSEQNKHRGDIKKVAKKWREITKKL